MKKFLASIVLMFFAFTLIVPIVEAKTNATKRTTVSSYRKTKNGGHKHVNYKRTQHYKK